MEIDFRQLIEQAPLTREAHNESPAGRVRNAFTIVREFMRAGYPFGIALAAVTNAQHESGLSNHAMGDKNASGRHESVGLFQLRWSDDDRGAGVGMSDKARQNPVKNTRRIIQETRDYGGALVAAYNEGATLGDLAIIFGRDIERPANRGEGRDSTARSLFGSLADTPANTLALRAGSLGMAMTALPFLIGGGVLVIALGVWAFRR